MFIKRFNKYLSSMCQACSGARINQLTKSKVPALIDVTLQGRETINKEGGIVSYKDDKCREEKESRRRRIQNAGGDGLDCHFL